MKTPPVEKRCSGCKQTLPVADFYRNRSTRDGLGTYCKKCHYPVVKKSRERTRAKGLPPEKYCPRCKRVAPLDEWHLDRSSHDGLQDYCKPCHAEMAHENYLKKKAADPQWYDKLLEKGRERQLASRLKRHGLDMATYESLIEKGCAICGGSTSCGRGRHHIDHDHKTEKFRGILCHNCNAGLGHFQDNPEWLIKAAEYLKRHQET